MPPAPATSVVTDTREHTEVPLSGTPALAEDGRCPRKGNARAFLARRRARRVKGISSRYDLSFGRPDLVENDYYRFRLHPRD